MKTGYSRICINPPYGSPLIGYYEPRFTKGILDDLFVRTVAFDDGSTKAVVIALDLCTLAQKYYNAFKAAISEATGIHKDAQSPFNTTVLCCITNSAGGYIPTTQAYEEGGYEAKSSALKPGGDDIIVNGMIQLLEEIK